MATEPSHTTSIEPGERVVFLTTKEMRTRYAAASAEARLFAELLRLAERIGRRAAGPVSIPVRMRRSASVR